MSERTIRIRVGVLIWQDGQALLVRHEKAGRSYWLVPGGGVDPGETMVQAAARELLEETGYVADIGRLLLVCEAIDPRPTGRHILNMVYAGTIRDGVLTVGTDKALRDARWHPISALAEIEMYPPIGTELLACCNENGEGMVRVLGNTWRALDAV